MVIFNQIFFGDFDLKTFLEEIDSELLERAQILLYALQYFLFFELSTPKHRNCILVAFVRHFELSKPLGKSFHENLLWNYKSGFEIDVDRD